jgi:hypothetical protein
MNELMNHNENEDDKILFMYILYVLIVRSAWSGIPFAIVFAYT